MNASVVRFFTFITDVEYEVLLLLLIETAEKGEIENCCCLVDNCVGPARVLLLSVVFIFHEGRPPVCRSVEFN